MGLRQKTQNTTELIVQVVSSTKLGQKRGHKGEYDEATNGAPSRYSREIMPHLLLLANVGVTFRHGKNSPSSTINQ